MARFRKLGKLFAATAGVAAIAASIGLATVPANAEGVDGYQTNTPHITINKSDNSVDPADYPNRYVALQIFAGDVTTGARADTRQLSNIRWGASINPNSGKTVLQEMIKSNYPIGTWNDSFSGGDGAPQKNDYAGDDNAVKNFGELFVRWLEKTGKIAQGDIVGAGTEGATNKEEGDVFDNIETKVTAHDVAEFLDTFANVDYSNADTDGNNVYPNGSPFTKSAVATGFANIFTDSTILDGNTQDGWDGTGNANEWSSSALDTDGVTSAEDVGKHLEHENGVGPKQPNGIASGGAQSWVIDQLNASDENADSQGLPTGYYLVLDRFGMETDPDAPEKTPGVNSNHAAGVVSEYMLQVVGGGETGGTLVDVKADGPTLDKKIKGVDTSLDADSVAIGDTVHFILTGTLPDNIGSYSKYQMKFTDKLGAALDFVEGSVKVYVANSAVPNVDELPTGATEVTQTPGESPEGAITITPSETEGTLTIDISDIFKMDAGESFPTITQDSVIYVTYDAKVTSAAAAGVSPNEALKNTAGLTFSNNPYSDGVGTTPDDSTQQYTYGINFKKTKNNVSGDPLQDAGIGILKAVDESNDGSVDTEGKTNTARNLPATDEMIAAFTRTGNNNDDYVYKFAGWVKFDTATASLLTGEDGNLKQTVNGTIDADGKLTSPAEHGQDYYFYGVTGTNGGINFEGLDEGAYTFFEAVTPNGFDTFKPYSVALVATEHETNGSELHVHGDMAESTLHQIGENQGVTDVQDGDNTNDSNKDGKIDLRIADIPGIDLPVTGGMGTALFIGAGVVLVVTACAYTAARKRHAEDAE